MTIISKQNKYLTLVNVFTVEPANQQKLVDLLTLATKSSVQNITGFISSSLHRSLDGTKSDYVCAMAKYGRLPEHAK